MEGTETEHPHTARMAHHQQTSWSTVGVRVAGGGKAALAPQPEEAIMGDEVNRLPRTEDRRRQPCLGENSVLWADKCPAGLGATYLSRLPAAAILS